MNFMKAHFEEKYFDMTDSNFGQWEFEWDIRARRKEMSRQRRGKNTTLIYDIFMLLG